MGESQIDICQGTRVFVLTGAGISAESGLPTFRDSDGLWQGHRVEDVATPTGWQDDPALVWRFYSDRRRHAAEVAPNPAHAALARIEDHLGDDFFLCTQNIDTLHERAGSSRMVHMHGELFKSRCEAPSCVRASFVDRGEYRSLEEIPRCACGRSIRPHVVWFGEKPFEMETIERRLEACHLLVVVGSSGVVYPAAGFARDVQLRQRRGEAVSSLYVGREYPDNAQAFDEVRLGKAGEVLPTLFRLV